MTSFELGRSAPWLVAEKEVMTNLQNFKIPACLAILTLLFLLSVHLLAMDYRQRFNNWSMNQTAQRDPTVGGVAQYRLRNGSFYDSAGAGHDPPMQPPSSLSVLVKGLDGEVDRIVTLSTFLNFGSRQDENRVAALFGIPDVAFVVKVMVSLLALFLSLDGLTREKEAGTLRALMAHPLRRRELLLGKAIGASVSLLVPLALSYMAGVVYLFSLHGLLRSGEALIRASFVLGLSALYGLVFVHLGLLISMLARRTKTAVVIALLVWAAIVVVLPNTAILAAELVSPVPTYSQHRARVHQARQKMIHAELRLILARSRFRDATREAGDLSVAGR
ncbi:hypothetical protein D6833_13505 [Candidatus Parcubacteria bacterium]|nr:MAG: hypothetical protein D6833_13505 [Candidatus Parcubacteria bacterium]